MIDLYPIDGITTNPSIVGAMKRPLKGLITDLSKTIGPDRMLHVQTLSKDVDNIIRESLAIKDVLEYNFYIKIPVISQGITAIPKLKNLGFKVATTTIFT